jgi:hypothetical protein
MLPHAAVAEISDVQVVLAVDFGKIDSEAGERPDAGVRKREERSGEVFLVHRVAPDVVPDRRAAFGAWVCSMGKNQLEDYSVDQPDTSNCQHHLTFRNESGSPEYIVTKLVGLYDAPTFGRGTR